MSDDSQRTAGAQPPTRIEEHIAEIRASQARIERYITGGEDPERGLLIKVDRLEQEGKRHRVWINSAIGAAAVALTAAIFDLFRER